MSRFSVQSKETKRFSYNHARKEKRTWESLETHLETVRVSNQAPLY